MKSKEIFSLAVRLLGLVFLYHGLQILPSALAQIIGSFAHEISPGTTQDFNFGGCLTGVLMAGWPLAVAYWLVRGAPLLMRTAYPDSLCSTNSEAQIQTALANKADA